MSIVHLIFALNIGGAEAMLIDIVEEQCCYADISVIIINNNSNQVLLTKIESYAKVYLINRSTKSKNPLFVFKLNFLLFKLKPDIVHCHNHNIIPLLLPLFHKKSFLTVHCIDIAIKYLRFYKRIFAISESVKNNIYIRTSGKVHSIVVKNGINCGSIETKSNLDGKGAFKILQVSRLLHEIKGQDILLKALFQLKTYEICVDFIGDGPSKDYLIELTKQLGLEDRVRFLGGQSREFIYDTLKDYDLLVQPSRYEGFGLTIAEGMAAKVPVLVSDIKGPMEVIQEGKLGYYFKSENYEELSAKIIEIIETYGSPNFESKVEAAYHFTLENYDVKKTAQNYLNEYKSILNL